MPVASSEQMQRKGYPIRVVVVDDHEMVIESLMRVLDREPDMEVVAAVGTVAEGLAAVRDLHPGVVVMDYHLPDGDGAQATRLITERWPDVRVVMLTGSGRGDAAFEAARAGCAGFLEKTKAAAELVRVVRSVSAGRSEMPAAALASLPEIDDLVVHYQPIVRVRTGAVVGYEALVRWLHPTRGLVPPLEFIRLAEQTTLIVDIGDRVRATAFRQAAEWNRLFPSEPPRFMSVNLSGREFQLPEIARRIGDQLEEAGLAPSAAMIEVTETFLVDDARENTRALEQLRELGVRIALDDFGTGYSSLGYLRRFPIDVIKLDKSFTDELPHGERGLRLVDAVGQLADAMGAVPEAEGIETEEQAAALADLGWELGQGYYFSRPVEAASLTRQHEADRAG
jgi:EAL domain-containing protein (putative c-di-GMP-specific phosphodiesterase class I)